MGEMFNGSLKAARMSPAVVLGVSAVVTAAAMGLWALLRRVLDVDSVFQTGSGDQSEGVTLALGPEAGIAAIAWGFVAFAVSRAVLGQRVGVVDAAKVVGPRIPAILCVGLVLLLIVVIPARLVRLATRVEPALEFPIGLVAFVFVFYSMVTFLFAEIIVVLERVGPIKALRRSWKLTHSMFWSTFGIALVTTLVMAIAGQVALSGLTMIPGFVAQTSTVAAAVGVVAEGVVSTITTALTAGVFCLLYVDRRMQAEGFDIELARTVIA